MLNEINNFVYDKRRRELLLDRLALSAIIFFAYYKIMSALAIMSVTGIFVTDIICM